MTELVRNPDVLAKAQHEVRRVVAAGDKVREADLPELHYLRLVIKETLRLHPAAPLLVPRETTEPFRTAHGVEITARTRVVVNAMAIHTDPGVWGPDAERFVPERHRDDADGCAQQPDGFALVPFGIGRRRCPGVHFAAAAVELLLANLLFCFDWRAPPGREVDVEEENGLAVHKKNPLVLIATKSKRNTGGH
jgi:cytochrome P450